MWLSDAVRAADMKRLSECPFLPWNELNGKHVLITGATGLIGRTLVDALLYHNDMCAGKVHVAALVRDASRAETLFARQLQSGCLLEFIEGSVESFPAPAGPVEYIIHCAAPTDSGYFVEHPVDTVRTIVKGTENILELARCKQAEGMVFLSSMEVYGEVRTRDKRGEADLGTIDLLSPRSSYPEGKRLAETLCCCYASQYQVPVTVARLAQTFGPGVDLASDRRVFAYMARCALAGEDICLKTSGGKENMYLYTADAVSAVLLLLLRGERVTAYNVANEDTYCSVRDMGLLIADTLGGGRTRVLANVGGDTTLYRPEGYLNLDTSRLCALGWQPSAGLEEMVRRMVESARKAEE